MIHNLLAKGGVAAAVAAISSVALAGPALASPPDLNGGRISWNSQVPCSDGGGVSVDTAPKYSAASGGTYRARLVLYSSPGGRLALGTLWQWSNLSGAATLQVPRWTTSSGYTGEAYTTLFVYRWNGSAYALVARESIPCL